MKMDAILFFLAICVVFTVVGRAVDKNKGEPYDDRWTGMGSEE